MRINENLSGFGVGANRSTVAEARVSADDTRLRTPVESGRGPVGGSALERVAAENAAAGLSRIRDASMVAHLASVTAQHILDGGVNALGVQANIPAATVAALLES